MKITLRLSAVEINTAITEYVRGQGLDIEGKQLSIDLVNGRKDTGQYAVIDITEPNYDSAEPPMPTVEESASEEPKQEEKEPPVLEEVEDTTSDTENLFK